MRDAALALACGLIFSAPLACGPLAAPKPQSLSPASLDALFDGTKPLGTGKDAVVVVPRAKSESLDAWLVSERSVALQKMLANVSPAGAAPGSVAASPSKQDPDYWYNWKRDAALTMSELVRLYQSSSGPAKQDYLKKLNDYAAFARREQTAPSQAGIGEPKGNMDGSVFTGPWGRPQDDGPAEEAGTLIALARERLSQGDKDGARALYGDFGAGIKGDLEYVSHRWGQTSFDVWEEVKAHHFDTEMAQRRALLEGAWLADSLGDPGAASWYREQSQGLEAAIERHWDSARGYIVAALGRDGGLDYKSSGLDSAVILGVIHVQPVDAAVMTRAQLDFFGPTDPRVLATAQAIADAFHAEYPLNQKQGPGTAIGRYPEDKYFGGNPWVLNTNAFAELYYDAAARFISDGAIRVEAEDLNFFRGILKDDSLKPGTVVSSGDPLFSKIIAGLKAGGDDYLGVVRAHANPDGSLSEQIDKNSGTMTSARDLTWNYASLLTAAQARDALSSPKPR